MVYDLRLELTDEQAEAFKRKCFTVNDSSMNGVDITPIYKAIHRIMSDEECAEKGGAK